MIIDVQNRRIQKLVAPFVGACTCDKKWVAAPVAFDACATCWSSGSTVCKDLVTVTKPFVTTTTSTATSPVHEIVTGIETSRDVTREAEKKLE